MTKQDRLMTGSIIAVILMLMAVLFVIGSCSVRSVYMSSTKIIVGLDHVSKYPSVGNSDVVICIIN